MSEKIKISCDVAKRRGKYSPEYLTLSAADVCSFRRRARAIVVGEVVIGNEVGNEAGGSGEQRDGRLGNCGARRARGYAVSRPLDGRGSRWWSRGVGPVGGGQWAPVKAGCAENG